MDIDLFEPSRSWLAMQPGLDPWPAGCAELWRQIESWVEAYAREMCVKTIDARHPQMLIHVRKVWVCWSYHWQMAAAQEAGNRIDGQLVAKSIKAGRGYSGAGRLGGDVIRDVILAQAVVDKDDKSLRILEHDYKEYAIRQGRSMDRTLDEETDWWYRLVDKLAGYTEPPGKLAGFSGRCGLQNWLGTVVRHSVYDQARRSKIALPIDAAKSAAQRTAEANLVSEECRRLWIDLIRRGLNQLEAVDRLLLCLRYGEGLTGKEAAALLKIHPGNVSRREEKSLEMLRECLTTMEKADAPTASTLR